MKKQTVIVTGASSGIGLETARYFLNQGDNVVINSQTAVKLEKVYYELGAAENLAMVAGNVSDKTTGEALVKTALERFGSTDVLINNAGIYENKPFLEVTEDYLDRFFKHQFKRNLLYHAGRHSSNDQAKRWCGDQYRNTISVPRHCPISFYGTYFE